MPEYRNLDAKQIVTTVEVLARRIEERFPDANLNKVAQEVVRVARGASERVEALARPNVALRAGVWLLVAGVVGVLFLMVPALRLSWQIRAGTELIQTLDALLEALFFIGGGMLFLVTLEGRIKRRRALAELHELRALAHIVDMHQLTKDPEQLLSSGPRTASSPERTMTDFELQRYLDYSTEMLALLGKIAALYSARMADPVVLSAVDEVEELTTGLSHKIWEKISLLRATVLRKEQAGRPAPRVLAPGSSGAKARHHRRRP
ncbi:MAG: hypothetical protein IPM35_26680 [Myxococcales bacterium]|nr:hypothetical protein [Myxococcales bacterium]